MKIAVRGGHNFQATGAVALIDETTEDRKVKDSAIKYLRQLGHEILDVTPPDMDTNSDLVYGVNKANSWGADLFISIHFNKAYNGYVGRLGTETLIYSKSDNIKLDEEVAARIVNAIAELGFVNRGVKEDTSLYELKSTKMASIIVEVCFVEATEDVTLYKKVGYDNIGKSIAEAIANKKVEVKPQWKQSQVYWWYDLGNEKYPSNQWMYIEGEYYYFNKEGYALSKQWYKEKEEWYYFLDNCSMARGQWIIENGKYYYMLPNGKMAKEDVYVDGKWYTIKPNGERA